MDASHTITVIISEMLVERMLSLIAEQIYKQVAVQVSLGAWKFLNEYEILLLWGLIHTGIIVQKFQFNPFDILSCRKLTFCIQHSQHLNLNSNCIDYNYILVASTSFITWYGMYK
ncbi:hypothetical protein P3S68_021597 [Capsicum galapagoense]